MTNPDIGSYVTTQLENRSTAFGKSIRTTAQTLHTIAKELRDDANTQSAADFADRGADVIDRIGSYFESSNVDTLMSDAEAFSRQRPWAVATIGVAAGLCLPTLEINGVAPTRHVFRRLMQAPHAAPSQEGAVNGP